ncbi:MAG: hypothetical protein MRJ92_01695 [Nitrospira sp.]|nr:hypothetical protein [Nitrospira sp.]
MNGDPLFAVRAAYQTPLAVMAPGAAKPETAYPYTFEDALAFGDLALFSAQELVWWASFASDAAGGSVAAIGERMYNALKNGKKAEFALDVLEIEKFDGIVVPELHRRGAPMAPQAAEEETGRDSAPGGTRRAARANDRSKRERRRR